MGSHRTLANKCLPLTILYISLCLFSIPFVITVSVLYILQHYSCAHEYGCCCSFYRITLFFFPLFLSSLFFEFHTTFFIKFSRSSLFPQLFFCFFILRFEFLVFF